MQQTVIWTALPNGIDVHTKTLFLSVNDTLVCEELLPGFSLPVSQVFAR